MNTEPSSAPDKADLLEQYADSHQHPVNRWCHFIGIPAIVLSLPLIVVAVISPRLWPLAITLFAGGWVLQFIGHAIEGKPPEFFRNWRFLFVGFRWWLAKVFLRKG